MAPLLAVKNLNVSFRAPEGETAALRGVDFEVAPGETVAIVGESGSGKSVGCLAALGLLPRNARVEGSILFQGEDLLGLSEAGLNAIRGSQMTMIFQEPMSALDPLRSVGAQIAAPLRVHARIARRAALARAAELMREVGVPGRETAYPHQLSGGERQRAMIAMAIANRPRLLIADEPTTALDVTVQARILELLAGLRRDMGMAMIFVSHDLALARRLADRVFVMRGGLIVESGPTEEIFQRPREPYTRMLIEALPSGRKQAPASGAPTLVEARGLGVGYSRPSSLFASSPPFRALDRVDLTLRRGQTLAVVGESGSGKSTLARALLLLTPSAGELRFDGVDPRALGAGALRALRRRMQIVFQDPLGSLSPRMSVGAIVAEGLRVHEPSMSAGERDAEAAKALASVGLDPATRGRAPEAFSGGQRQRIAIARALILKPDLLVLDEPTSALDRSVQRDILALLREAQRERGLTYLFITHDLAVARAMADEIMVMRAGRVVERGPTEAIFERPSEDYTRALIAAAGDAGA